VLRPACATQLLGGDRKPTVIKVLSSSVTLASLEGTIEIERPQKTHPGSPNEVAMVKSVIIVDDNPVVRKLLCEAFTTASDFSVCGEAANGTEAIEKAQLLRPDLIITDFAMPVMNGLEEARVLRHLMPTLPVILYTMHAEPYLEKEARLAGADAVVSKSEGVATLIAMARTLLNKAV
jgi:CheY-like chemotaxis protein